MSLFGRRTLGSLISLLAATGIAQAYNSEEHKILADWGASLVRLHPSITLPFPTRFHGATLAARRQVYMDAKYLAAGFATNNPERDYNEDVMKVQDHSYWTGYAQLKGNKDIYIPADSFLRETTLVVGGVTGTGQQTFSIGELVSIYGDYRRTVHCVSGDCYLTNASTPTLTFDEGTDCFPWPINCGWRPSPRTMTDYLRYIGSGLWPPYGQCGNASGNTADDNQYYDAGWWGDEMLRIAGTNDWHFSSAAAAWYVGMHRLALLHVDRARTDPRYWNHALHYEANALHSLTDLFAFGHVVTNRDRTSYEVMKYHGLTGTTPYRWMEHVINVGGGTRSASGRVSLSSALPPIADIPNVRNEFLASYVPLTWAFYALQEKHFHDAYNQSGAMVRNLKGDRFYIWGDSDLPKTDVDTTAAIVAETVRASLQSLFDAYVRLQAGERVEQIGDAGDPFFEALKNIPIFVEYNPVYTFEPSRDCPTTPSYPSQETGNNYNGRWTLFAAFVDQVTGAHVVPANAGDCLVRYEDGEREIEGPVDPEPCAIFPERVSPNPRTSVHLAQSRPNPASLNALIEYALPVESLVKLEVFDSRGACVSILDDGVRPAGTHFVLWEGTNADGVRLPAGVYYYRLVVPGRVETRKLVLLR